MPLNSDDSRIQPSLALADSKLSIRVGMLVAVEVAVLVAVHVAVAVNVEVLIAVAVAV